MCSIFTTHLERERGVIAGGIHLHVVLAKVQGTGGRRNDGKGGGGGIFFIYFLFFLYLFICVCFCTSLINKKGVQKERG